MKIKELLEFCGSSGRLYCYGAGRYGRETAVFLSEQEIFINAFLVSRLGKKDPQLVLGFPIYELDRLEIDKKEDGILLAVSGRFKTEMEMSLSQKGFQHVFAVDDELLNEIENSGKFSGTYPNNQFVNILLYHRVIDLGEDPWNTCVSPEHFEQQVKYLSEHYTIVRFEDDWNKIQEPSVVITFDDGYFDNFQYALPILEKYSASATFFVSTDLIEKEEEFWWDRAARLLNCSSEYGSLSQIHKNLLALEPVKRLEVLEKLESRYLPHVAPREAYRMMSREELCQLAASSYVTIGVHTKSHSSLALESEEMQREEITGSKIILEKLLGQNLDLFSYPFGYFNSRTIEILQKSGFRKAATVAGGLAGSKDPFRIPRNVVRNWELQKFQKFMQRNWCVFSEVL